MERWYIGKGHGKLSLCGYYKERGTRLHTLQWLFLDVKIQWKQWFIWKKCSVQKKKGGYASSPLLRHRQKSLRGFRKYGDIRAVRRFSLFPEVCSGGLFSGRSIYGTYASARTAIQTQIRIDHVLAVFFGNGFYRTFRSARAAADAIVRDFICHDTAPPSLRWYHSIINGAKKK